MYNQLIIKKSMMGFYREANTYATTPEKVRGHFGALEISDLGDGTLLVPVGGLSCDLRKWSRSASMTGSGAALELLIAGEGVGLMLWTISVQSVTATSDSLSRFPSR